MSDPTRHHPPASTAQARASNEAIYHYAELRLDGFTGTDDELASLVAEVRDEICEVCLDGLFEDLLLVRGPESWWVELRASGSQVVVKGARYTNSPPPSGLRPGWLNHDVPDEATRTVEQRAYRARRVIEKRRRSRLPPRSRIAPRAQRSRCPIRKRVGAPRGPPPEPEGEIAPGDGQPSRAAGSTDQARAVL